MSNQCICFICPTFSRSASVHFQCGAVPQEPHRPHARTAPRLPCHLVRQHHTEWTTAVAEWPQQPEFVRTRFGALCIQTVLDSGNLDNMMYDYDSLGLLCGGSSCYSALFVFAAGCSLLPVMASSSTTTGQPCASVSLMRQQRRDIGTYLWALTCLGGAALAVGALTPVRLASHAVVDVRTIHFCVFTLS